MAITLTTTIGGASSDSYNSVAEFDAFLALKRNSATVLALSSDDKALGLLETMDLLEINNWRGARATTTQALSHPRSGLEKRDSASGSYLDGYAGPNDYLMTEIAGPVKRAQCELAFAILDERFNTNEADDARVEEFQADNVRVKFGQGSQSKAQAGQLPVVVARLLSGLLQGNRFQRA